MCQKEEYSAAIKLHICAGQTLRHKVHHCLNTEVHKAQEWGVGGGGVLNQGLHWDVLPQGLNLYLFKYHF